MPVAAPDETARWLDYVYTAGPGLNDPLPLDANRALWDGRGGQLPWPCRPIDAYLRDEAEEFNTHGVPMERVGAWLARAVATRSSPAEIDALLAHLPTQISGLLALGRPADAAALVAPLFAWASSPPADARLAPMHVRAIEWGARMLPDKAGPTLERLSRRGQHEGVAALFAALPPAHLGALLDVLAATPRGAGADALAASVRSIVQAHPHEAARAVPHWEVTRQAGLLQALAGEPTADANSAVGLAVIDHGDKRLLGPAVELLIHRPERAVADRLVRLLGHDDRSIRRAVLRYACHHRYAGAWDPLRELAEGPWFDRLGLDERIEVAAALWVIGGTQALALIRRRLAGFESKEPDEVMPWLRALALMADAQAVAELQGLVVRAGPSTAALVHGALADGRRLLERSSGHFARLRRAEGPGTGTVPPSEGDATAGGELTDPTGPTSPAGRTSVPLGRPAPDGSGE